MKGGQFALRFLACSAFSFAMITFSASRTSLISTYAPKISGQRIATRESAKPPSPLLHESSIATANGQLARQRHIDREIVTGSAIFESCARLRPDRLLVYAAHSGFGNQELALRRALLVAYITNRTLVLPPILRQSELAFGVPEKRCRNASWQAYVQARAEQIYQSKLDGHVHGYESMKQAFNFEELQRLGMRVADYAELSAHLRAHLAAAPLAPIGCAKQDKYTAEDLRRALRPQHSAHTLRLGSAYFLHANIIDLSRQDQCFRNILDAVLRLPQAHAIERASRAALNMLSTYASTHLRLTDDAVRTQEADARVASGPGANTAHSLDAELSWLARRMNKRLSRGRHALYVATNAPGGIHSAALAPLCGNFGSTNAVSFHCWDLKTIGLYDLREWKDLLVDTALSIQTASILVDQAIAAAAPQGFFSTSKFCGRKFGPLETLRPSSSPDA